MRCPAWTCSWYRTIITTTWICRRCARCETRWAPCAATGLGNARHLAKAGIRSAVELDWWQSTELAGARVTYVPAQHFSSRGLHDRNRCLWGGFVIEVRGAVVYFAGDSGYCPHFAEIGRRFPRIDLALLPIGAYEPRWFTRRNHVDPQEAVRAHLDLKAASQPRDAFRHLPVDRRSHRCAGVGTSTSAGAGWRR